MRFLRRDFGKRAGKTWYCWWQSEIRQTHSPVEVDRLSHDLPWLEIYISGGCLFSGFLVAINSYRWFKLTFFIPRLVGGHDFNLWVQVMWNSPSQKGHDCRSARSRFFYHTYMHYIYIFIYIYIIIHSCILDTQVYIFWSHACVFSQQKKASHQNPSALLVSLEWHMRDSLQEPTTLGHLSQPTVSKRARPEDFRRDPILHGICLLETGATSCAPHPSPCQHWDRACKPMGLVHLSSERRHSEGRRCPEICVLVMLMIRIIVLRMSYYNCSLTKHLSILIN